MLRRRAIHVWLLVAFLCFASSAEPQTSAGDAVQAQGALNGTIVDDTGAGIAGATIAISWDRIPARTEVRSREDGRFSVPHVPAGPFRLTVSEPGFADQTVSGVLRSGDIVNLPPIRLTLAVGTIDVAVTPTSVELAERQIREQEQQRVLGVLPNFHVSYDLHALPLTAGQKFELSWKSRLDPVRFATVGIFAGVQQARGNFAGFGQGASGYTKRYAAAYANLFTGSMITQVLLPSLLRQDPRYFYKGTGSVPARIGYAISRTVIRKGDSGHWQPNYSGILGRLTSGALSNLYYPAQDRKGVRLTLENTAIGIGGAAVGYLAQEFFLRRLTSHSHRSEAEPSAP